MKIKSHNIDKAIVTQKSCFLVLHLSFFMIILVSWIFNISKIFFFILSQINDFMNNNKLCLTAI